ncbi:DUF3304 domain-containing protein [Burkholderia plantarii]|uniref:DUF3304 domain-containing protein n=1 Tax=Burkholderia plantarii TaxID=41899 RepID=A0A0B6RKR1_BURPL|nr:DUF3304 domain-containing protein [Burkholderia plantarii]AJK45862.1 hypothetical protein BGL_1c13420 [Burkholderia plantarii]
MIMSIRNDFVALFVVGLLFALAGCPGKNEINPSNVSGYNYTGYYIGGFSISNEGQGISAGGPNVFPKEPGEERSGGGKYVCCIGIPEKWRPGMKLVVKWRRDTHPYDDDRSGDQWLTATTEVPPYGPRTAGFIVHFLPDDRIRIQIRDEKGVLPKIDDRDPYIVQGVLDAELNKG